MRCAIFFKEQQSESIKPRLVTVAEYLFVFIIFPVFIFIWTLERYPIVNMYSRKFFIAAKERCIRSIYFILNPYIRRRRITLNFKLIYLSAIIPDNKIARKRICIFIDPFIRSINAVKMNRVKNNGVIAVFNHLYHNAALRITVCADNLNGQFRCPHTQRGNFAIIIHMKSSEE